MKITRDKCVKDSMGAVAADGGLYFSLAVPDGEEAVLILYEAGQTEIKYEVKLHKKDRSGDIASVFLEDIDPCSYDYNYKIGDKVITDPYCRRVIEREDGSIAGKITESSFSWGTDKKLNLSYENIIAYKLHVRGFTKHPSSKVKHRGTFEGIREKIGHLKDLGINQIECMPVYAFEKKIKEERVINQEERENYWGYGPGFYFALQERYSASDHPADEFKNLVRSLHENGIEIVLEFHFIPGTNPRLVMDCLKYWVEEYHIDGFHLNDEAVPMDFLVKDPYFSHVKIMCGSYSAQMLYDKEPLCRNIAEYHDGFLTDIRKFLKGDENQLDAFLFRMKHNPPFQGVINYVANHNGFTLSDMVSYERKHNDANGENGRDGTDFNHSWNCGAEGKSRKRQIVNLRKRQIKNALAMLMFAQGTPLIMSGDEFGKTQEGNNNPYCQDNELTWVNWKPAKSNEYILPYLKEIIAVRKAHPILHMKKEMRIMDTLSCGYPDLSYHGSRTWYPETEHFSRHVGIMYCGQYAEKENGEEEDFFYFAYNMHWIPHEFALPTLPKGRKWEVLLSTGETGIICKKRSVAVPDRTTVILIGRREKE